MLLSRVDYGPPPMPWDDVTVETSGDQWRHYMPLFQDFGYREVYILDENGRFASIRGPDLPPPVDSFNPRDDENYVHIPVKYAYTHLTSLYPAVRVMVDNSRREVAVKVIRKASEREVVEYLADQRRKHPDPRDHTIPFLRLIDTGHCTFLVMPCWAEDATPFYAMGEPVEMLKQCLEGILFLHEHRIAHRDISPNNIVINYQGSIAAAEDRVLPFRSLFDVRYGFIDFNESTRFPREEPLESIRTVGHIFTPPCGAPELSETVPYNPFPVDIYALGIVMKECINEAIIFRSHTGELLHKHMPEFVDLLLQMMNPNPEARPTAAEAYERVCALQSQTDPEILALHGQPVDDAPGDGTPNGQTQKDAADSLEADRHPEDAQKFEAAAETGNAQPESVDSNVAAAETGNAQPESVDSNVATQM